MFRHPLLVRPDTREDYGEKRPIGNGMIQRVAFVAFAERHDPHHLVKKGQS